MSAVFGENCSVDWIIWIQDSPPKRTPHAMSLFLCLGQAPLIPLSKSSTSAKGFPEMVSFVRSSAPKNIASGRKKTRKTLPTCLGRKSFEGMKLPSSFFNGFCQLQEDPWGLTIYFKFRHIASILTEHRGFNWMGNSVFFQKPPSVTVRKSLKLHAASSATR